MRDLLILVLALAGGILAAYAGSLFILSLVGALMILLIWGTVKTKRRALGLLAFAFLAGFLRAEIYQVISLDNKYYVNCSFQNRIGIQDRYLHRGRLIEVSEYQGSDQMEAMKLVPGQRVRLSGTFVRTAYSLNGVVFCGTNVAVQPSPGPAALTETLSRWKLHLTDDMTEQFGLEEGSLAASLVLGIRQESLRDKGSTLKYLGIIHILSISGFHVNLLEMILKRSGLRRVALPLIFLYALLINSIPAWRACLMKTSRETARWLHRDSDALNQLLTAAFLLLLMQPWYLFSPSFQLTFGATLGLIVFQGPLTQALDWLPGGRCKDGMILSTSAMIPCLPTLAAMSFDVNLALFPANLILVPIYSLYCMGAFLSIPLLLLDLDIFMRILGAALRLLFRVMELMEYVMVEFLSLRVGWSGTLILIWLWLFLDVLQAMAVPARKRFAMGLLLFAVLHFTSFLPGTTKVIFHKQLGQARVVVQQDLKQYEFVTEKMNKKGVAGRVIAVESPLASGRLILTPSPDIFPGLSLAGKALAPLTPSSSDIINEEYLWIFGKWIRLK